MNRPCNRLLPLVSLCLLLSPLSQAKDSAKPDVGPREIRGVEVTRPEGSYAVVHLTFSLPGEQGDTWRYVGGMREGKLPIDHGLRLGKPGGVLTLEGGKLTGTFTRTFGMRKNLEIVEVTVDAAVTDGEIVGTAATGAGVGKVTGRIVSGEQLAKVNDIPADKSWPMYLGPVGGGVAAEPTGVELVDSFNDARLMWRTEETDIGQGIGSISRMMDRWRDAGTRRTGSGSASPVAGGGKVFLSYYVPSPARGYPEKKAQQMAKEAGKDVDKLPEYALQKIYPAADDVVLAMDAETGKTLWKAVMKDRGINHQHHKEGPFDMTPAYHDGRVFAIGMSGWLYAFDAETGKPLWEVKLAGAGRGNHWSSSVVALPGVVVAPQGRTWCGFDPKTGKRLWQSPLRFSHSTIAVWRHGRKDYLVSGTGGRLVWGGDAEQVVCMEARTGKEVWKQSLPGGLSALNSRGRGLGPGGITISGDYLVAQVAQTDPKASNRSERRKAMKHCIVGWKLSTEGPKELWQLPMTGREGSHTKPVVHGKYLFTGGLEVVDLASGKVLSEAEGVQPGNGGYMQAIEDLVFVRRDGTHGVIEFAGYRVSEGGKVTKMDGGAMWTPGVGGGTTSYHHPLTYPLIDGRIYIRQKDGVYCWDLRKGSGG